MALKVVELEPRKRRKFTLTEDEQKWLEYYMLTGKATEASRMIGHPKPREHGSNTRRRLAPFIEANMKAMIGSCAPAALETIYRLATESGDDQVKLRAAQDLLNRAGYGATQKHEISVHDMSDEELDNELSKLLSKANIVDADIVR